MFSSSFPTYTTFPSSLAWCYVVFSFFLRQKKTDIGFLLASTVNWGPMFLKDFPPPSPLLLSKGEMDTLGTRIFCTELFHCFFSFVSCSEYMAEEWEVARKGNEREAQYGSLVDTHTHIHTHIYPVEEA